AGLLLAMTATFISTAPPRPDIFNYTARGPYLCIWLSIGVSFGGLIVSSVTIWILSKSTAKWFTEIMMKTRSRVFMTQILMAYPFLAIMTGTIAGAIG
ncbi:hypothetical protein K435DRAFT_591452, partial [Dendrothele bispora CBS 962.96]